MNELVINLPVKIGATVYDNNFRIPVMVTGYSIGSLRTVNCENDSDELVMHFTDGCMTGCAPVSCIGKSILLQW